MASEALARRFKPAGFEQPEGSRQNYTKPSPELQKAFDEWMGELPELVTDFDIEGEYKRACQMIKPFGKIPYREANSLLADLYPKNYGESCAGEFISACYNQSLEDIIVFDLDSYKTKFIGYRLRRNKVLVNNGKVGFCFGSHSHGVVVNNQIAGENFGYKSDGIVLNNGETWDSFGMESSGLIISDNKVGYWFGLNSSGYSIIIREPISVGRSRAKRILRPNDIEKIPELGEYLEELCDLTKAIKDEESARIFLEKYGPKPREKIGQNIKKLLSGKE